jgi:hypothetical protein
MTQIEQTIASAPDHDKCARLNDDCRWLRGDAGNFRQVMTVGVNALIAHDDLPDPDHAQRRDASSNP